VTDGVHILFHFDIVLLTQRDVLYQDYQIAFDMIVNKVQREILELLEHILRRICFPLGQLCVPFSLFFSAENVAVTIIEGYHHRTENGRLITSYIVY